ncbi:MAG: BMP family ABC transporter substrate-binding protein [Desulfobacterales bacterium]|jgi:simple sugar transport system substrate-binding protein
MTNKVIWKLAIISIVILIRLMAPSFIIAADEPYIFGLLLVGSHNDHSESHEFFEAGKYAEKMIPGTKMIYIEKVNPTDRPDITIPMLVHDMVEKGAKLIIASSIDMKDSILESALSHPEINFIQIFGDEVLTGKAPKNLSNLVVRMEYGKMMAGFAAALTTKTGKIGYLGPLANQETRLMAVSCYLGAKYAWENVLKKDPKELKFQVTWIGFWFNIPGVTAEPAVVAQNLFNTGYDVVVSGISTNEALVAAKQKREKDKNVWAIPYLSVDACESAPEVCLCVPYFNWGPGYIQFLKAAMTGKWQSKWLSLEPDWKDINNPDTSPAGFVAGSALTASAKEELDGFIKALGSKKIDLFKGPLYYQDGSPFIKAGQTATDKMLWVMNQLLMGMTESSNAKKTD